MEEVQIGKVIKPHGVRGELVVEPTTDEPKSRFAVGEVLAGTQAGTRQEFTVEASRPHQGRLLVRVEEITDRTAAESLRGMRFMAAPREEAEGFYDHELEGMRVIHDGQGIGEVTGVMHTPAGMTLEVRIDEDANLSSAGRDVLIPFKLAIVPEVNIEAREMVVTPPEGLLEL